MRIAYATRLPSIRTPYTKLEEAHEHIGSVIKEVERILRQHRDAINTNEASSLIAESLPPAAIGYNGRSILVQDYDGAGTGDAIFICVHDGSSYVWKRTLCAEPVREVNSDAVSGWENSWTDNVSDKCFFYRDESCCRVFLEGEAYHATPPTGSGNPMFTLPAGYRPTLVASWQVSGGTGAWELQVDKSGKVYPVSTSGTTVYLNGISFRYA